MNRWRRLLLGVLVSVVAVGCGQPSSQPAAVAVGGAEHRFVHVHEFPDMGARIAPPTSQPRLRWQQALQAVTRHHGDGWGGRAPPQVKLADYSSRTGEGPTRPTLVWVVVYPDAKEVSFGGPDFAPAAARVRGRCPAYVVVDATSGRGRGAFQTCQPPYRG